MERLSKLKAEVQASATNRPGVYRMLGPSAEVLYVGKSVRVRSRLLSYFRADRGEKAGEILSYTRGIDWEYHPSEFAALLAEFRLIRRLRPVFNVVHKKQKAICFIRVTGGAAPRIGVVRSATRTDGAYHGPLLGVGRVGAAVRVLEDLLELRTCRSTMPLRFADQIELFEGGSRPLCVRPELGRCLAPCAAGCTESAYRQRVREVERFLDGTSDTPLAMLRERLRIAAERWQYEYAASLLERAALLESVRDELMRTARHLESLSFVYAVRGHDGEDRWYLLRGGRVLRELAAPRTERERAVAGRAAARAYRGSTPRLALLGGDAVAEALLVARWFRRNPGERSRAVSLEGARRAG